MHVHLRTFCLALGAACLSIGGLAAAGPSGPAVPARVSGAAASITERDVMARVRFLASDELVGRDTLSNGLEVAARYLATELEAAGLEPAGDDGTYLHAVGLSLVGVDPASSVSITGNGRGIAEDEGARGIQLDGAAATLLPGGAPGTVEAPVVFVGYGIRSEEHGWDDYAGVDVEGKVALMLRYEPNEKDPESAFDGTEYTRHAYLRTKIAQARRAGAAAVLLVTGPRYHRDDNFMGGTGSAMRLADSGEEGGRRGRRDRAGRSIPAVHISQAAARQLLAGTGLDLAAAQQEIDTGLSPRPEELDLTVRRQHGTGRRR
jgi:hypothetical protein